MAKIIIDANRCKGCGLCVNFCPKHLIILSKTQSNSVGYHPAEIENLDGCIGCMSCATVCPDMCIKVEK